MGERSRESALGGHVIRNNTCEFGGVELLGKLGLESTCIGQLLFLGLSKQLPTRVFVRRDALGQGKHLALHRL